LKKKEKISTTLTINQALETKSDCISLLAQTYSKFDILNYLIIYIDELCQFIGITLTKEIMLDLSKLIYNKCYYYNLEEISVLFNWLKEQKYYSRTANEILLLTDNFIDIRLEKAEQISLIEHKNIKGNIQDEDFIRRLYEKKKANPIEKDAKDLQIEDDLAFQKFKAEYHRKKKTT